MNNIMDKTLSLYKKLKTKNSFLTCFLISSTLVFTWISLTFVIKNIIVFLYNTYVDLINYTLSFFPNNNIGFYSIAIFLSILFYSLVCHFIYRREILLTSIIAIIFGFIFGITLNYFGFAKEYSNLINQSTFFCQFFYAVLFINTFSPLFIPIGIITIDMIKGEKEREEQEKKEKEEQLNLDL